MLNEVKHQPDHVLSQRSAAMPTLPVLVSLGALERDTARTPADASPSLRSGLRLVALSGASCKLLVVQEPSLYCHAERSEASARMRVDSAPDVSS